jgi:hypothetical protein
MKDWEVQANRMMIGVVVFLAALVPATFWYDVNVKQPKDKINFENQIKELIELRAKTFAFGGEVVGKLRDGRTVTLYVVRTTSFPHHVYVVDNSSSVSTNKTVQTSKNSFENQVETFVESEIESGH